VAAILPLLRWPAAALALAVVLPRPVRATPSDAAPLRQTGAAARGAASKERKKSQKPPVEGVLNVNRASEAELRLLPGIGQGRARAIVAHRPAGGYRSVDEVARLKRFRKLIHRLRAQLSTDGPTTLRPRL
jgi:competence protein ComEA